MYEDVNLIDYGPLDKGLHMYYHVYDSGLITVGIISFNDDGRYGTGWFYTEYTQDEVEIYEEELQC